MIKILFVCHGNICRSPMAEFIFKDLVKKAGCADKFYIASAATSTEEIGSPPHSGTKRILDRLGISCKGKYAVQVTKSDYYKYDYIIGMDNANIRNLLRLFGGDNEHKLFKLLEFANIGRDVDDPWYTGRFETTYKDILMGCEALLKKCVCFQKT